MEQGFKWRSCSISNSAVLQWWLSISVVFPKLQIKWSSMVSSEWTVCFSFISAGWYSAFETSRVRSLDTPSWVWRKNSQSDLQNCAIQIKIYRDHRNCLLSAALCSQWYLVRFVLYRTLSITALYSTWDNIRLRTFRQLPIRSHPPSLSNSPSRTVKL